MPDLADVIEIDLSGVECAYFREWTDPEGEEEYLLFDQDGDLIISTNNRSMVFFFAVEHEIPLMTRH